MNGSFWLFFTIQVGIPGSFLLWLFASDVFRVCAGKLRGGSRAGQRDASTARRGSY
jgi:hypothetical protein